MNISNFIYLKDILGDDEVKRYLGVDSKKIILLVDILKKTKIKEILQFSVLCEFCNRILYGIYGDVFGKMLVLVGDLSCFSYVPLKYFLLLEKYVRIGYCNEEEYRKIVKEITLFSKQDLTYEELLEQEIKIAKEETTIDKFIKNNGSMDELVSILSLIELEEFDLQTKIPVSLVKSVEKERYEVDRVQIGFLVSMMSTLKLGKELEIELLEVYYKGLEFGRKNGFSTNVLIVENKPKLYRFLKEKGYIANIIKEEKNLKRLEKKK